jgi:Na+/melibiose symporter-like transporter
MIKQIALSAIISCAGTVGIGLLFAASTSGRFSLQTLLLPGVIPVMLIASTAIGLIFTPLTTWALKPKKMVIYGSPLWVILAVYVLLVTPENGAGGLYGVLALSVIGLTVIAYLPER